MFTVSDQLRYCFDIKKNNIFETMKNITINNETPIKFYTVLYKTFNVRYKYPAA